jgi:hypothetical protein
MERIKVRVKSLFHLTVIEAEKRLVELMGFEPTTF